MDVLLFRQEGFTARAAYGLVVRSVCFPRPVGNVVHMNVTNIRFFVFHGSELVYLSSSDSVYIFTSIVKQARFIPVMSAINGRRIVDGWGKRITIDRYR